MGNPDFIREIAPAAVEDMMGTGVLASITIAQAILESNWGRSAPGNNLFGVKGSGQQLTTEEEINGIMVTIVDGFAVYDSWLDSIKGHSTFLRVNGRYEAAGFFSACANLDFRGAARALQRAGYATDSAYADKLVTIIASSNLYQYDKEAHNNMQIIEDLKNTVWNLQQRVTELEAKQSQDIPEWAAEAVQKAVDAELIDTPEGGSLDFYRIVTILNRAGLLK